MKTVIVYEDDAIIVCRKPAGLPVQTKSLSTMDMESELKNYLQSKNKKNEKNEKNTELSVVHRLDQPVEGIMVFAKNKMAAANLSSQVSSANKKSMQKTYEAIVYGEPEGEEVTLVDYLYKDGKNNTSMVVDEKSNRFKDAKKASLTYSVIKGDEIIKSATYKLLMNSHQEKMAAALVDNNDNGPKLLRIQLLTGRHHQIRVQLSNAGYPIIGDLKYGCEEAKKYSEDIANRQLQLRAVRLAFTHPVTGKNICFGILP